MAYLLGIDLGTSSLKCLLMAEDGSRWYASEREYPIVTPHENWAEQEPEAWWQMAVEAIREVVSQMDEPPTGIKAIGLSGQMHGTVFLGANRQPLRRAIIWADQRSHEQCRQVYDRLGFETLAEIAGSGVFPGFMLASLLWVQQHESHLWEQVRCVLFPKDYVRFRLTEVLATEVTDASGGLLLDVQKRGWSTELTAAFSIPSGILPPLFEAYQVAGQLTPAAAQALGLPAGIPVVAGAADQCTGALGSGLINPGVVLATLGTGGQLVTLLPSPRIDKELRIHTFCHALPDTWYLLGATLAAGLSFRWLRDNVLEEPQPDAYLRMTTRAAEAPPGAEGLIFLPYLVGERLAKDVPLSGGSFVGLTLRHNRAHLIRATMEGILFSLKRILDVFATLDVSYTQVVGTGGGARNPLWRQMMADIFQCPVSPLAVQEQSALGAVILAGLGTKLYNSPQEACNQLVSYGQLVEPRPQIAEMYQATYESFNALYRQKIGGIIMSVPIKTVASLGQSIWYDNIERRLLNNGELAAMVERGDIQGLTSNPSIFNNAIANSDDYDADLLPLAKAGKSPREIFETLAVDDIRAAADLLRPLYDDTNGGDGYVSLEVNPTLAYDTEKTLSEAKRLFAWVDRPNLMIKIPGTEAGLPAIRQAIAAGLNINVTLIFSIERYRAVMDAYLSGLEDRASQGLPLAGIASVASFFVSRIDVNVDKRLNALGTERALALRGKTAIANARLAYQAFKDVFGSDRFATLKVQGAQLQRPLWASTGTKNPDYPDTLYVDELVGPNTVNTMPPATLDAFRDHGQAELKIESNLDKAQRVFAELAALEISIAEVTQELEEEGVKSFADAFASLLDTIEKRCAVAA